MAKYSIAFNTMEKLSGVGKGFKLALLARAKEFDDIHLRQSEKKILNDINKPSKNSEKIPRSLVQAMFGSLKIEDFGLSQDTQNIFRLGTRVL
eukprot:m.87340 g.87340  ORF g.87340 m.87340 type:complete len:93 (-) comp13582_c0_seq12:2055-2333(-)